MSQTMETGSELLFFAGPEMGHLLAEVELGRRIASVNPQISIALLIPKLPIPNEKLDEFIQSLNSDLQRDPDSKITIIELPPLDNIPPELTRPESHLVLIDRLTDLYKPIVKRTAEARRRRVAGIIFDMFCSPMVEVAEELGVPSYLFFTSGANMLSMMFHMESLKIDTVLEFAGMSPESTPVKIPGLKSPLPFKSWPAVFTHKGLFPRFMKFVSLYRKAKGILVNTFSELESNILLSLSQNDLIPPVYAVGPILHLSDDSSSDVSKPRDPTLSWLDEQPAGSVVFFCFGSKIASFEKVQVEQLALGIEKSGHRFLWSLRAPSDVLPEGFLDRTAEIGKVIGWAPQTEVLGHVAVGAFVSHCGWNSVLESLWFGVPLVTWPMYAEQSLNAFLLVKELGLGVDLKMDYRFNMATKKGNVVVGTVEVEAAIRRVMNEEEGVVLRKRVKEISELARKSMEVDGSSHTSLSRFINDVIQFSL